MDMAFLQRARRMLGDSHAAPLDHRLLLASLAGRAMLRADSDPAIEEPLVELLSAGPDWRHAARAQAGCFNRAEAGRRRNAP